MTLIRSLIFFTLFYLLMAVMGILCLPLALASRSGTLWSMTTYCRITLWLLQALCGIRVEVRGTPPSGDVIVASKHQSFLDILIHTRELPRPRFIMKKSLRWAPILGIYAIRMGSTPVHRGRKGETMARMVNSENKQSGADKGQLVIYPQGTRVAPGSARPYKVGAGVLYQRFGKICVPAATNAGLFWGRNQVTLRPGVAVIDYLDPVEPGLPLEEFMATLEDRVEAASNALLAEHQGAKQ